MSFTLLLAMLGGICLGIMTGLTPGIHVNLISVVLLQLFYAFDAEPFFFALVMVSMSITHTFLDSIPALLFGVPEPAFALLPQHQLLHQGKGYEAIKLMTFGSFFSLLVTIAFLPLLLLLFNVVQRIEFIFPFLLAVVLISSVLTDRKKTISITLTVLAGLLGLLLLRSNIQEPLFILFTGFFGLSGVLLSLQSAPPPKQDLSTTINIEDSSTLAVFLGVFSSSLCSILPGLGSAHAAFIVQKTCRKASAVFYLILVGGINTVSACVGLIFLYAQGKTRNGVMVVLNQLLNIKIDTLFFFILLILVVSAISTILTFIIGKRMMSLFSKVNVKLVSLSIGAFLIILTILLSGFVGFIGMLVCTAIGILTMITQCKKSNLMACLILPLLLSFI